MRWPSALPILGALAHVDRQETTALAQVDGERDQAGRAAEGPFHAWTYTTDGRLAKTPHAEDAFDDVVREGDSLRPRPCLETEGLVFVRAEGDEPIDEAAALLGIRQDMGSLDLGSDHRFEARTTRWRCNWKLILDTFVESYHVFSLHRETVHPWYFSPPMIFDGWGANLRFPVARRTLADLEDEPETSWRLADHATIQWLVGGHSLISYTRDYLLLWHFSSPEPGACDARTTLYSASPARSTEDEARFSQAFDLQLRVTGEEDFPMQEQIQRNLDSGAIPGLVYGRSDPLPRGPRRADRVRRVARGASAWTWPLAVLLSPPRLSLPKPAVASP